MEDFDYFNPADWDITVIEDGSGNATEVLEDADGGRLLITNDDADDDQVFFNKVGESFLFEVGKKLWFDCIFQISEATESDLVFGLQISDTTPLDVSDGVFFLKSDGSNSVDLIVEKGNVPTTTSVATLLDATDIRLSFFYDGVDSIKVFVDGVHETTSVTTNLPDDEVLTVSFGVKNGEAAAKTMSVDYVMAAKERL